MRVCLLSVFVATLISSVFGIHIEIYPSRALVNNTVLLNVKDISGTFRSIDWYKGQSTSASSQIIRINEALRITNGVQFFPEVSLFNNGSLQIRNAQESHAGYYTVSVQTSELLQDTALLTLYDSADSADSSGGLNGGEIAGIVIGVLAGASVLLGLIVYVIKKKDSTEANFH